MRYALAGFPSGAGGAWTFCEIEVGDFVSLLYGARAHNLYHVTGREALADAEHLPPWKPLTFRESGKTYSFPFRLRLQPIRIFVESLVRAEFSYVAENLLLRGGYRRTHFQADQTTLQSVSQMGEAFTGTVDRLSLPNHRKFNPSFTRDTKLVNPPETCRFQEVILQTAIRRYFQQSPRLDDLLRALNFPSVDAGALEILGEKASTQGHIDLLLKERVPLGSYLRIPLEVKMSRGRVKDLSQLRGYMDELSECPIGILIASDFSRDALRIAKSLGIALVRYDLMVDLGAATTFEEICRGLSLHALG